VYRLAIGGGSAAIGMPGDHPQSNVASVFRPMCLSANHSQTFRSMCVFERAKGHLCLGVLSAFTLGMAMTTTARKHQAADVPSTTSVKLAYSFRFTPP